MYKYFLGLRYLLSRPINLLSLCGVVVAVWALIVIVSIFSGYIVELQRHIKGALSDLSFIHAGTSPRDDLPVIGALIGEDEDVVAWAPRLGWHGLLHTGRPPALDSAAIQRGPARDFVQVIGVDPAREVAVTDLGAWIRAVGDPALRVPDPDAPFALPPGLGDGAGPGMLVGLPRVEDLGLRRGDRLSFTSGQQAWQGEDVQTIQEAFTFAGAFSSPYHHFDVNTVIVPIDEMRRIFGGALEGGGVRQLYNEISIRLRDGADLDRVRARLELAFELLTRSRPGIPHGLFRTWREQNRNFLDNVAHQEFLMKLMLFVLVVVAAFLIFATLSMMVTEKTRDIGILAALGATRGGVLAIFAFSGLAIAVAGTLVGTGLAMLSVQHLDDFDRWLDASFGIELFRTSIYGLKQVPHRVDPVWVLTVTWTTMALSVLSALIPGFRASRMDPVRALRYECS
ncbi:MAG: FtsX-like permease family protein [Planctomycetota bacterium]